MMPVQRNHTHKQAFTLVELLVVMAVMTLLASLVLSALSGAAEQARENRTRSQIQKIHELLMSRYEDYRYRRVPPSKTGNVRARQADRVDKIRELMRMEMPNYIADLQIGPQVPSTIPPAARVSPSLWKRYRRTVERRTAMPASAWADINDVMTYWSDRNQESECLYMILESIQDGDTNGLDFFRESEIGDTDGDGMPEILDGWGRAIIWVRWAPGHLGAQTNLHDTGSPDPFDPLGVRGGRLQDEVTGAYLHFPLFPLVVSQGPDDELHMVFRADDIAGVNVNDPYHVNTIDGLQRGAFATDDGTDPWGHYDNITNHQLIIGGNE